MEAWVAGYEQAWRSPGTDRLAELFTDDASYLRLTLGGAGDAVSGASVELWEAGARRAGRAVHDDLRGRGCRRRRGRGAREVDYATGSRWRDLWVLRFAADGRCASFEEWPFAPGQPDGH